MSAIFRPMPIIKSAKKALRSSARKNVFNVARKEAMKESVKDVRKLAAAGQKAEATKDLATAYKAIDKAAKGGTIKKNAASRKKSRLAKFINKSK